MLILADRNGREKQVVCSQNQHVLKLLFKGFFAILFGVKFLILYPR